MVFSIRGLRLPFVLVEVPIVFYFDVAATRIIQFDIQDLDSVEQAKNEILSQVKSLESGKSETDNPISVSLDLKLLKESGNPEQRSLADVVEAISELRSVTTSIEKRVSNPEGLIPLDVFDSLLHRMRKMMGPETHMYYKEFTYEIREMIDRVSKIAEAKKFNAEEVLWLRERLERMAMRFEDMSHRIRKFPY